MIYAFAIPIASIIGQVVQAQHRLNAAEAGYRQHQDRDVIDVEARVIEDLPALPAPEASEEP